MEQQLPDAFADRKPVELRAYQRVDSRTCLECGARAGQCDTRCKTQLQADSDVVWLKPTYSARHDYVQWTKREREQVRNLIAGNFSNKQIAEIMNKTEGAIAGQRHRAKRR